MTSEWLSNPHHWDPPNPPSLGHLWSQLLCLLKLSFAKSLSPQHWAHSCIQIISRYICREYALVFQYYHITDARAKWQTLVLRGEPRTPDHCFRDVQGRVTAIFFSRCSKWKKKKVHKNNSQISFVFCFVLNFYKSLEFIWAKLTIYTREQDLRYFFFVEKSFHSIFQA